MSQNVRVDRPPAVVLGSGVNLIEVVRSLSRAGVRSAVVAPANDPARLSRHVVQIATWDWSDPRDVSEDRGLLERLVDFARTQAEPPPLLFTSDGALLFVCRHRDELAKFFRFVIADSDSVEAMADKARFATLASRLGFRVPLTRVLEPGSAPPADLAASGYPLIVKPYLRDRLWHESVEPKKKAIQVRDEPELFRLWGRLAGFGAPVVIQECVPGPESRLESYHVYVDDEGKVVGEFTGRKIRTMPVEYGNTTGLVITDAQDVIEQGRDLVRSVGLVGVAKVDFKRAPSGDLYVLEVNPRLHLWHHAGAVAGVNIPELLYADLTNSPRPSAGPARAGVRWVHPLDLYSARVDGISTLRWIRWARTCEAKAFWSRDDPLPLLAAVVSRVLHRR